MKFCSNCGKQLDDSAVFCDSCGTNVGGAPAPAPAPAEAQPNGTYTAGTAAPGSVSPPVPAAQQAPGASQPGTYYQGGPQQTAAPQYGTPQYQAPPYGAPPKRGGNKAVIVIICVAVALALVAGGFLIFSKLRGQDNNNYDVTPDIQVSDSYDDEEIVLPSEDAEISPSYEVEDNTGTAGFELFDAATGDNVIAALEEIGIDTALVEDLSEYGSWYGGPVYTFYYKDSVFDLLINEDGSVFSVETGGVQLYIDGYESYNVEEYLGYTTHFDESYPDNGYVFYLTNTNVTSSVTIETSSDLDYVIELIDMNTGDLVEAFYVQANQSWRMAVPEGDYYIQYAAGATWYGTSDLFGEGTTYTYKADSTYSFYPDNEATLVLDVNGGTGIASTAIPVDEF